MRDLLLKAAEQAERDAALVAALTTENAAFKARIKNTKALLKKALGYTDDQPNASKIDGGAA